MTDKLTHTHTHTHTHTQTVLTKVLNDLLMATDQGQLSTLCLIDFISVQFSMEIYPCQFFQLKSTTNVLR